MHRPPLAALSVLLAAAITPPPAHAEEPVDFNRDVRPILARNCLVCHGRDPSSREAGLRLDTREGATSPTRDGPPAIVPGDASSLLIERVRSSDPSFRMPPAEAREALTADEIDVLERWIAEGAPYAQHWSWTAVQEPEPPPIDDPEWARDAIDRYVLHDLERTGLSPAAEADPSVLVRRLHFDLVGLPPAPEVVARFVADPSDAAYARLVDELLASPRFGERFGRHWLDLMRYAETHGHEFDYPIRHAWRYRDYVIRAINADVPYDELVIEHLAGDLLEEPRRHPTEGFNESIIGTGFWFLCQGTHGPVDVRGDEAERIDNQIEVFGKTFLATTISCARCHDHKFDAVTQADYYALSGFMQSSRRQEAYLDPNGAIAAAVEQLEAIDDRLRADVAGALASSDPRVADHLLAAVEVIQGEPREDDPPEPAPIVLADFEGDDYGAWTAEGTAFGPGPQTAATLADHQGDVGPIGRGFVNSHNVRGGEDVRGADRHTGTLTSAPFVIQQAYLRFRIGGGNHPGRTCINLLVDGEIARTATGHNDNRMRDEVFDLRDLVGREATIEIVDREQGGWGNIGIDHLELASRRDARQGGRPITGVARERNLDTVVLGRWVEALRDPAVAGSTHPLQAFALAAELTETRTAKRPPRQGDVVFESFDDPGAFDQWYVTGTAFGSQPTAAGDVVRTGDRAVLARPGVAHSGRLSPRLQGTLRSPTFEIESEHIRYRLRGAGGRIRVIVDGFVLDEYNALLFEGLTFDVNTEQDAGWTEHVHRVGKYRGHRAHIELIDDGDGFLAVDSIVFVGEGETIAESVPDLPKTLEQGAAALGDAWSDALDRLAGGSATTEDIGLLSWAIEHDLVDGLLDAVRETLTAATAIDETIPAPVRVLAIADGTGEDEHLFVRGDHHKLGDVVPRDFIDSLHPGPQAPISEGSGRLELARRLLAPENPLPARVYVNRVWHHLFGRGLVATTDDFGALGGLPTHPALLDGLAWWFTHDAGWSTKALVRRLVTSSTYRQSSTPAEPSYDELDPTNALWHRANRRRLQGEAIRDAILAVSGRLDTTMYGPPVAIHLSPFMQGRGRPGHSGPLDGDGRRSIYIEVRRNFLSPMMLAFDMPTPATTVGRRSVSNVPAQALIMMNDPFVVEQAGLWAGHVLDEHDDVDARLDAMYRTAYARSPSAAERAAARAFLEATAGETETDWRTDQGAWAELAHVLFSLKEFIYVD